MLKSDTTRYSYGMKDPKSLCSLVGYSSRPAMKKLGLESIGTVKSVSLSIGKMSNSLNLYNIF